MSTTASYTAPPIGTPLPDMCSSNSFPNLDYTGMSGLVCAVSIQPAFLNITSCCIGEIRVAANNCTQYCNVKDGRDFNECTNDRYNSTGLSFIYNLCENLDDDDDEASTGSRDDEASSTSSDSPEETSAASNTRLSAWGYSVLLLSISTVTFTMFPY
ncbi:hypothetical protein Q7P37_005540 [Cladosporium fusiforme]